MKVLTNHFTFAVRFRQEAVLFCNVLTYGIQYYEGKLRPNQKRG